jgi:YD repeat-containing protein
MSNGSFFSLRATLLCAATLLFSYAISQTVPNPPKDETPNVATLDKFGDIPVDMATGVPNISIPIHTLKFGNINVPVALRYHPSAVRVAQHPGWVGSGWDLEAGGVITRQERELADELLMNQGNPLPLGSTYYPESGLPSGSSGSELINNNANWNSLTTFPTYFEANGQGTITDVSADEFSFNFMGYSGKFYYEGPSLGWQVQCDQNVSVQVINTSSPFLSGDALLAAIVNEYNAPQALYHLFPNEANAPQENASQVFAGFMLTTPDGTKYTFGSTTGAGIEFYSKYGLTGVAATGVQFFTDTWLLTKIVDVDGNEVDFNYSASYPVADLGFGYQADSWSCEASSGLYILPVIWAAPDLYSAGALYATPMNTAIHAGRLLLPLYLDNITCKNETVSFTRKVTNACLRFPEVVYRWVNSSLPNAQNNEFDLNILGDGKTIPNNGNPYTIDGVNNLQWEQLDTIAITNGNGQLYRQYQLTYSNDVTSRLTLQTFLEKDNAGNSIEKYSFAYNSWPNQPLYDANYADHWGFFNGISVAAANTSAPDNSSTSIFAYRQTVPSVVASGLLSQITYPTGGYTNLTWEAHDYSQVVDTTRQAPLKSVSPKGYAGGSRIREIQSYLADGSLAHDKKYLYVRGYTNANPGNLTSSGILNGIPTYTMNLNNRKSLNGQQTESIEVTYLNSLASYSYNSESSYIGYDEVVELNEDGSYTRNFFTSYGPDLNGISHWDVMPLTTLGWLSGDKYYTLSELDMERGKPMGQYKYNVNDVPVQKVVNTYRNDAARFNNYLKLVTFNNSYSGCTNYNALILATANQVFTYDYYVTSKTVTTYDQNGMNPQVNTTAYQYNSNNLVSVKTETDSKGETIVTTYKYPPDLTDATSQAMTAAHILTPVEQTTVTNNGTPVSTSTVNYYSPSTGMYKPQTMQMTVASNPVETRQSFYAYDSYGNIEELSKANDIHDVYLWGYYGQYPVLKITGSTVNGVNSAISSIPNVGTYINNITNVSGVPNESLLLNLFAQLRTALPNSLVTGYTYLPLSGLMTETDPKGLTTNYQYDPFQRLQMITDNDGNVLKTFTYQYQIPQ